MKKIKLNKGLKLNKEAITKLQETQMSHFKGGVMIGDSISCLNFTCNTSCNEGTCNGAVD
jgi:hypothetical protein